jgi:hypothetical protein
MSFRATALWRRHLVVILLGLACNHAAAQVANSPVVFVNQNAITTTFIQTTNLGGSSSGGSSDSNQWLKVEFHYGVTPAVGDYLSEVQFKIWIEGLDLQAADAPVPGKGVAVALTGSVTYVNVPRGKDLYGVVYVHPAALGRYNAGGGYQDFDRKFNIHVEADVDGKPVDTFDKNKEQDPNWYQPLRAVPGLLFLQNQSPFITTDADRYPELKLPSTDK